MTQIVLTKVIICDRYDIGRGGVMSELNVFDVADYFLVQSNKSEEDDPITHLKLQKLVYYAQGYHLAMLDSPLFGETILAYKHGPVCSDLYDKYRDMGSNPLPVPPDFDPSIFDESSLKVLSDVWEYYSQFSATGLRNLTHGESPWKDTPQSSNISQKKMKEFFKTLID